MQCQRMKVPRYFYVPLRGLEDEKKNVGEVSKVKKEGEKENVVDEQELKKQEHIKIVADDEKKVKEEDEKNLSEEDKKKKREEKEKKKREEDEKRKKEAEEEERKFKEQIIRVLPKFWVKRGPPAPTDSGTYNGVYHRTSFKVSGGEIYITSLGFYGPTTRDEYISVDIEITTEPTWKDDWHWLNTFLSPKKPKAQKWRTWKESIHVKKGKIFYVKLECPVRVLPGHWMEIGFCLEGKYDPVKFGCMKVEGSQERSVYVFDADRDFELLPGSRQMPYLVFSTKNPKDESSYMQTTIKKLEELGFAGFALIE